MISIIYVFLKGNVKMLFASEKMKKIMYYFTGFLRLDPQLNVAQSFSFC